MSDTEVALAERPAVRAWTIPAGRLLPVPDPWAGALAPARWTLTEWTDCVVRWVGAQSLIVGGVPAQRLDQHLFRVRFENAVGLSALQGMADGGPVGPAIPIEVVSSKFTSVAEHVGFLDGLLGDLQARAARLSFALEGPTNRSVAESNSAPSPLFVLHFVRQHGRALLAAWEQVRRQPKRALVDQPALVPAAEATEADVDVVLDFLGAPERWVKAPAAAIARRMGGYAPLAVWQRNPIETLDTAENRFVRAFLRTVSSAVERLREERWWPRLSESRRTEVATMAAALHDAVTNAFFDEVREMRRFPSASRALMRRAEYRELLELWLLFHVARRPLFDTMRAAMELRSIDQLYEMWAFFALVDAIEAVTGRAPEIYPRLEDERGLGWSASATFGTSGTLTYNRPIAGYSMGLRPDFVWECAGDLVVLDAKFRLDRPPAPSELSADDDVGPATRAKREDLYKMHTYRDALRVRAAVVVYPGDTSTFLSEDRMPLPCPTLEAILTTPLRGIGAISLRPSHATPEGA